MSALVRALLAAAGVVAFSASALAAELVPQTFVLPSSRAAELAPAPAFAPKANTTLSATALHSLFDTPFSAPTSQLSGGSSLALEAGNGVTVMMDAVAVHRSSNGSGYLPMGAANAIASTLNWNFADWGGGALNFDTALDQSPLFGLATKKSLGVSAFWGLGEGWVGSVSYSENQLDLKPVSSLAQSYRRSSYGVAIAKHGLFGDDTLGLLLSRPDAGQNSATSLNMIGASTIPSLYVRDRLLEKPADADIELGYVTSFLDGTVALQTNASYQLNFNSKKPDSVSLLSRAKIKF